MLGRNAWAWLLSAALLVACGGGGSDGPPPPPVIGAQPLSLTVDDGATAGFSVSASGGGVLRYQWSRNDQAIAGATTSGYTTPILTLADHQASYRVSVSNEGGTVISQAAMLSVRPVPPSIGTQPLAATVSDGQSVGFAVQARGSLPLSYQWLRNGQVIDGATQASFSLAATTLADDGAQISVRLRNIAGEQTSQSVALGVTPVPATLQSGPEAVTVKDGEQASFRGVAKGSAPLSYQWLADGQPIAGATATSYTLTADYAASGRRYSLRVSNAWGSVTSEAAPLTVTPLAPSVTQAPRELLLVVGQSARFSVTAGGTAPLRYQWERSDDAASSWKAIAGATGTEYEVKDPTLAWHDVRLRVVVSNVAGSAASSAVALKLQPANRLIAGRLGGRGYADGIGANARFDDLRVGAFDAQGNLYVVDAMNHVIRRVSPAGEVSTWAGKPLQPGTADGGPGVAQLSYPLALALDASGNVYVGEAYRIRRITPAGVVSTLAGGFESGFVDSAGANARFSTIVALASDAQGNLLVLDGGTNGAVRRVSRDGVVSTLAGSGNNGYDRPHRDGQGSAASFKSPSSLAWGSDGKAYVADAASIRLVDAQGRVSLYAGSYDDTWAERDGLRLQARFGGVQHLALDNQQRLYALTSSGYLRRIDPDGNTYTLAGSGQFFGERDGQGAAASFFSTQGMAISVDGQRIAWGAINGAAVREASPTGLVRTLAGAIDITQAAQVGLGAGASLGSLASVAVEVDGQLLVATESSANPLLRVQTNGTVTAFALQPGTDLGCAGPAVRSASGTVFMIDRCYRRVVRISPEGAAETYAGSKFTNDEPEHRDGNLLDARFSYLLAIALAPDGALLVSDQGSNTVRRIAQGQVSTLAGQPKQCGHRDGDRSQSLLCTPVGLAVDAQGRVLVADMQTHTIRRIDANGVTSTVAGTPFGRGLSNGAVGRFANPNGVALDALGNIYVSDADNALIRRINPDGFVSSVMGTGGFVAQANVPGGAINRPKGVAVLSDGRLVVATEGALIGD